MVFSKKSMLIGSVLAALAATSSYANDASGEAGFTVSLNLFSAIHVTKVADLDFGDAVLGAAQDIKVNSKNAGVAKFNAVGDRNARILATVVETSVTMANGASGANNQITVDNWNYGGSLSSAGEGQFNVSGALQDMDVGGVAHILADTEYGSYSGNATFRVTYL
ncbi:MAG: DUF4402 domain-containing protein [Coxiellaceae bacterium]|nr:DUF4402 domain-containing protein [Coxiellaceae bacterium]